MATSITYGIRWSTGTVWQPERLPLTLTDLATIMHTAPVPSDGEIVYSLDGGAVWTPIGTNPERTAEFLCGMLAGLASREGLPLELGDDVPRSFVVLDQGHRIRVTVAPC